MFLFFIVKYLLMKHLQDYPASTSLGMHPPSIGWLEEGTNHLQQYPPLLSCFLNYHPVVGIVDLLFCHPSPTPIPHSMHLYQLCPLHTCFCKQYYILCLDHLHQVEPSLNSVLVDCVTPLGLKTCSPGHLDSV